MTNYNKWKRNINRIMKVGGTVTITKNMPIKCTRECEKCEFIRTGCLTDTNDVTEWMHKEYKQNVDIPNDLPVDAKVLVCDEIFAFNGKTHQTWKEAHYAGIDENGDHCVWRRGQTSWTLKNSVIKNKRERWEYIKLPTEE